MIVFSGVIDTIFFCFLVDEDGNKGKAGGGMRAPKSIHRLYATPFIHPFIHSSIHPFIHSSIHPFIHSSIHPFIPSSTHPFIPSSLHLPPRNRSEYNLLLRRTSEGSPSGR